MTETTSAGPVLETTVGGVLRAAAERAAQAPALVEGTADRRSRRRPDRHAGPGPRRAAGPARGDLAGGLGPLHRVGFSGPATSRGPARRRGADPVHLRDHGLPQGRRPAHRGITNNARYCAEILQASPGEVWVNPMPLFHTAGCVLLTLGPVQGLFTQVLVPGFDPALVLHLLESEGSAAVTT